MSNVKAVVAVAGLVLAAKLSAGEPNRGYLRYPQIGIPSPQLGHLPPAPGTYKRGVPVEASPRPAAGYFPYVTNPKQMDGMVFIPTSLESYDRQEGKRIVRGKVYKDGVYVGERTVEETYDNLKGYKTELPPVSPGQPIRWVAPGTK